MPPRAADSKPGSPNKGGKVYCAWQSLNDPGLEIVTLSRNGPRLVAEGKALRILEGRSSAITWRIVCDPHWRTRALTISPAGVSQPFLAADCNGRGLWSVRRGRVEGRLAGCIDVQLAGGPFSHTLPIRRLGLSVPGEEVCVRMAFADPAHATLRPARRSYTLLEAVAGGHRFLYRDLETGDSRELLVDDFGLVQDHAGLFRMIWCA
jgi:uncharacterized protein